MRTQRTLKNYLASVLYTGLTLAVGLVVTPLLIRHLGETKLGAFRALSDWFGYLSLLELGLGGALLAVLARAWNRKEPLGLLRTLGAGVRAYLWVMLAMLACGAGLALFVPGLVNVPGEEARDLRAAALVLLSQYLLMPLLPFRMLTEASQQSYKVHALLAGQSLLMSALMVAFAFGGMGIRGQALATVLALLPMPLVLVWHWLRRRPELRGLLRETRHARLASEEGQELKKLNRDVLIFDATGRVSLLSDNMIVAYFLGASQVVPFFVTLRLVQIAQGLLQGVGNASWAAMAELHARGDLERFNARIIEITRLIAVLALAALVPITAFNDEFVSLWVGPSRYAGGWISALAAVNAAILGILSFWVWCFSGTGKVGRLVPTWILWSVVNLGASLVLTRQLGLVGPLLGTLISYVAVTLWRTPFLMKEVFGTHPRELFTAVTLPLLLALPFAGILGWISRHHSPGWWLLLEAPLGGALFVVVCWFLLLDRPAKELWRQRLFRR